MNPTPFPDCHRLQFPQTFPTLRRSDFGRRGAGSTSYLGQFLSPTFALLLILPLCGYYTLVGTMSSLLPEGNLGGLLIRAGSLAVVFVAFMRFGGGRARFPVRFLLPAIIFLLFYSLRLAENFFLSEIRIPQGPEMIFLVFFFSGVLPALLLTKTYTHFSSEVLTVVGSILCLVFVAGMLLNMDALIASADRRMMLDKINPISLAHTAVTFILYYLVVFWKSPRLKLEAAIFVPILLVIVIYARSRGAMIAGAATVLMYILLTRGNRRIYMLAGLSFAAIVIGLVVRPAYVDIVLRAFERISIENDLSTSARYTAFAGAWKQFTENFAFGRYVVETVTGYYPHNIYLEALMSVGLVGTVPFAIHCAIALRASVGIMRDHRFPAVAVLVALLFVREAIASASSGSLWGNSGFWLTSFLAIAFWSGRDALQPLRRWPAVAGAYPASFKPA